jgi:hypothetical protein
MKSFLQYITEAGIRRKERLAIATEKQAGVVDTDPTATPAEKTAANRAAKFADTEVRREQNKRIGRVLSRAKTEAEASEPPITTGGIYAHAERLERVGEKAGAYAIQMAGAEKPGFARRKRGLTPHGNDGY